MLKNKKIHFELLTRWLTFIFSVTSYEREVKKYQITFEIADWKTEKKDSLYFILYAILYRNINRKALKRLLFFDSVVV